MENKKIDNEIISLKSQINKIDNQISVENSRIKDLNDLQESITSMTTTFNRTIVLLSKSISGPTVNNKFKDVYDRNRSLYMDMSNMLDDEINSIKGNINKLNEEKDKILKDSKNKKE